jgi:hypothetical protein
MAAEAIRKSPHTLQSIHHPSAIPATVWCVVMELLTIFSPGEMGLDLVLRRVEN